MKVTFVVLATAATLVMAQAISIADMVHTEVQTILANDATLDVAGCTDQCDAMFALVQDHDETYTDHLCHNTCAHQLRTTKVHHTHAHNSHHHHHTTVPSVPSVSQP